MSRINDELEQAVQDAEGTEASASAASGSAASTSAASTSAASGKSAGSVQARAASDEARPVTTEASEPQGKRWGLLLGILALMGGVLTLVFTSGKEAVAYSYRVDEIKAQAGTLGERLVRVQGSLVAGTLVRRDTPCEYRFLMRNLNEKTGEPLEVRYPLCIVPDTFRDKEGVEVTAEGRLAADGHLQASKIFAKCPSKYDPSTHQVSDDSKVGAKNGSGASEYTPARVELSQGVR